jgi:hypothetical protein
MNRATSEWETAMMIRTFIGRAAAGLLIATATTACGHMMMMVHGAGAKRPAASEFGLGPRTSLHGLYTATLQPVQPLRTRQMQTVRVKLGDVSGVGIDAASITVDGGMPEHGHGLPTKPRVTRNLGDGVYEIEGVRFNMGGWWELTLAISTPDGNDNVTFNLSL